MKCVDRTRLFTFTGFLVLTGATFLARTGSQPNEEPNEEPVKRRVVDEATTERPARRGPTVAAGPDRASVDTVWPSLPEELRGTDGCPGRLWRDFASNVSGQLWALNRTEAASRLSNESKIFIRNAVMGKEEQCRELVEDLEIERPTVNSVIRSSTVQSETVTFVTQLHFNDLDLLGDVMDVWKAAISVAVYITAEEVPNFLVKLCKWEKLMNRTNIDIHLLLANGNYFPRNRLRNVARANTKTALSFLCDVDLIPRKGTEELISEMWRKNQTFFEKNVLVIPAFEMLKEQPLPESKTEVIEMWNDGLVRRHRYKSWVEASSPTDYRRWKKANGIYPIDYVLFYEPYIVMKTSLVPVFNERFIGNRFENSSLPLHIWAMRLNYHVMADSFLIQHGIGDQGTLQPQSQDQSVCTATAKTLFIRFLMSEYGMRPIPKYKPASE